MVAALLFVLGFYLFVFVMLAAIVMRSGQWFPALLLLVPIIVIIGALILLVSRLP